VDPPAIAALHADACAFVQQGVEDVSRTIRVGEQLAPLLFVERHTDVREETDRLGNGPRLQHLPDRRSRPAVEVAFRDPRIADVASSAAAYENLGAGSSSAVHQDGAAIGRASGQNGGGESGSTGADDDDVHRFGKRSRDAALSPAHVGPS